MEEKDAELGNICLSVCGQKRLGTGNSTGLVVNVNCK